MTTPTPTLTIDLACRSCIEFAELAPLVTGARSLFMSSVVKQLDKNCGRRFEVKVVDYPVEQARSELEAEVLSFQDVMSRSQRVAERLKTLLEAGDEAEDALTVAGLIKQVRDVSTNPFMWSS
jgi:hypothetical protein